ncbi:hypothetical protein EVAR_45322_1 [Eumeta japonica]|uniref:Uncharacterized protein n=1 Tax=Eumeta variegata TaxID=151549 RepID=A0A4C1XNX3_EUMVA|nr:hypothetical protein EVAR_45322_1 [Eumeta japonica]
MRSLLSVCGVPRKDRCRNSDVRERCGLKEDVVTWVERCMLWWFTHLERMKKQLCIADMCDGRADKHRSRKSCANQMDDTPAADRRVEGVRARFVTANGQARLSQFPVEGCRRRNSIV